MNKLRQTVWLENVERKKYPKLEQSIETDVVVIGGGITGVLTTYLLSKEGRKVVLIEKKQLGDYATKHTTAFLCQMIDTELGDLISTFGENKARKVVESHGKAIDLIEHIVQEENIDCDFMRCSDYMYACTAKEAEEFEEILDDGIGLGLSIGLEPGEKLGFENFGYVEIKNQAKFHPLKFIEAIAEKAVNYGAEIYENTEAKEISESPLSIKTDNGTVNANWIISATYEPFKQPFGLFFKKGMYRSYILELHIPKGKFPEGIYEGMDNPYHYFRIDRKKTYDRMIIGG
ncbi:FAD-binding oxidoreductase, partial [Candidatus Parcubacteria bacterium]|nr:FAD-binding oxidoreductase [Candidatus Parcubacteria bacterium]